MYEIAANIITHYIILYLNTQKCMTTIRKIHKVMAVELKQSKQNFYSYY